MEQSKHRRVILFPLPFPASHINPMLQLANILHTKGFSITIIHTNFNSHNFNPSAHPHFTFISIPDGLSESEAATNNILHLFSLLNVKCVEQFRECLASLLSADANSEEPIACLISDKHSIIYYLFLLLSRPRKLLYLAIGEKMEKLRRQFELESKQVLPKQQSEVSYSNIIKSNN
ncbi:hypothetical protein DVH24_024227 [Malus domestica]|uniref:Uncharacterized protein n=1 Tax=Malus domestica TaxID=3750 RepID=A0A498JL70_MALDO|nr:hypothetical protein DVH24_024227 [Malus domestica]